MNIQEEILKKYEEFANFLQSIHIEELKKQFTRKELMEFQTKLDEIKIPSFSYKISKLIDEMKKEEFPQLSGVHHFPSLQEIDFMSEKKKIELDKFLLMIRNGEYVFNLFRFTQDTKKLTDFLIEKGIVEKRYSLVCPHHYNEKMKVGLSLEELNVIKEAIQTQDHDFLEGFYDDLHFCDSCDDRVEYPEWRDNLVKEDIVKVKDRDTSLDNV
ncbi:hypothetical protein CVD28_03500 [Bacillus sp. M6-12]|uniref:hypothetical protein n=1 Tax=Bacillus sp. M6-12 TaxID=2054166 RepID=UPI000C757CC3|nr:hypothetical protein [Bacillus sp. M6-12]PLS19494.1 hypothetical protein CVD28_03500 [Bacillus sp. M6-12]